MIIAIASQKGGTSKTTTASALWTMLPNAIAIDLDTQGSLTATANADEESEANIYTLVKGKCTLDSAIQHTSSGDIIASAPELATLRNVSSQVFATALAPLKEKYQHIILDTPPTLGALTTLALAVADIVVIAILAEYLALRGVSQLADMVTAVQQEVNPNLKIGGLLLTRFNARPVIKRKMQEVAETAAAKLGTHIFNTVIREGVVVQEAQTFRESLLSYAPNANVTLDYIAFAKELEEVMSNGKN